MHKNQLDKIKSNIWLKNWSAKWHVAFSSLYCLYTTDLKLCFGKNLKFNLLVCEKDVSANYISKKDLDNYCNYTAKLIKKDNSLAFKWADQTIYTANKLFKTLNNIKDKKDFSYDNLIELRRNFYLHIPPHFSIKKVIDYLPLELQEKLSPKLIEARIKTENLFNVVDDVLVLYSKLISRKTGYNLSLAKFLTIDEMEDFFKDNKIPSQKELSARLKGLAIFCQGKNSYLLTSSSYKAVQKHLINMTGNQLKGNVAYEGFARGIARIVFDPSKVKEFNQGDILVTGMTRPEFLPLMKKSSAFVTDAGGLLSHAAIVARELKKPCILATENATKILKDGDLIEVDANNGIIKIKKRLNKKILNVNFKV